MSTRNRCALPLINRNRFDPVDGVLQNEEIAQLQNKLVWEHRIGGRRAEIEKKRTGRFQDAAKCAGPLQTPMQVIASFSPVEIFPIRNPKIVRRRGDSEVDRLLLQLRHSFDAID
jgi:hypothetical protein